MVQHVLALSSPYYKKGSAFSLNDCQDFKLYGLLLSNAETLD